MTGRPWTSRLGLLLTASLSLALQVCAQQPVFRYDTTAVSLADGAIITAQLADTPEKRQLGLMYRKSLDAGSGMLFIFEESGFHSFWMKNCEIPLDIVWMNERKQIVDIEQSVPPCKTPECPSYTPAQKARYVIELQAGTAERKKLAVGQTIFFELRPTGAK